MYGSIEANRFNICSLIIEHTNKKNEQKKKIIIFESLTSINTIIHILYWHTDNIGALHANRLNFSVIHMKCTYECFLDE